LNPQKWLNACDTCGHGTDSFETVTKQDYINELLMMGLRTNQGITRENLRSKHLNLDDIMNYNTELKSNISKMIEEKYLVLDENGLRTTKKGLSILESLLAQLVIV